jgi:ribonuclease HII
LDLWHFERIARKAGYDALAGVDEAGRGPLAGPVVSAAVVLPRQVDIPGVDDSKKLTPKKRSELFGRVYDSAVAVGIGIVGPGRIDRINILQAALLSMRLAVSCLSPAPECLLIDGSFKIQCDLPQYPIAKGDSRSISIAAASIIAKVTRDRLMKIYDGYYPRYGLAAHKGYPTKMHKAAVAAHGCSPIHRKSFKGVKEFAV